MNATGIQITLAMDFAAAAMVRLSVLPYKAGHRSTEFLSSYLNIT